MDNQLPSDGLEDFLKKSFEQYTESPPPSVWGNIEQSLPVGSPAYITLPGWIKAAAAVVVIAGSLLWIQHKVVSHQIGQLNAQVDSLKQTIQLLHREVVAEQTKNLSIPENSTTTSAKTDYLIQTSDVTGFSNQPHAVDHHQTGGFANGANTIEALAAQRPADITLQDETLHYQAPANATSAEAVNETVNKVAEVSQLAARPLIAPNLFTKNAGAGVILPATHPIRPLNAGIRWSVGTQFFALNTKEKIKGVNSSDNPFYNKPLDPEKQTGKSWATGLTLAAGLDQHWQLQSGLLYKQSQINSTHHPMFRFRDRGHGGHHGPGGGGQNDNDHAFDYDLNTSMGVVSMEIDLRQNDTTQHIEENEQLDFDINTQQTIKKLCIPLVAQYQIGRGRLHLNFKGGLMANFLLDTDLDIKKSNSLNGKFSIIEGRHVATQNNSAKPVSIDYLAGIGLSYDLNHRLSFNIEPIVSGALINNVNPDNIQASTQSWGINGGIVFRL